MAGEDRMSKSQLVFTTPVLMMALAMPATAQMPPPPGRPPVVVVTPPGPSTKVGMLTCSVSPGVGFIIGGRQSLACRFQSSSPSYAPESYLGDITTVGLDIGISGGGSLAWAVFMPTQGPQYGALSGEYVGASAEATFGVGIGGNVLIGGSNRAVTLQPFSVEGDVGVNLAVGVSSMVLREAR
jgi:hypothetical protein